MGKSTEQLLSDQMKLEISKNDGSPDEMRKNYFERITIQFAGTFIGQAIFMQFEKMLWSLEKTAAWISNNKTAGRKSKSPVSLIRPLPWIVFLPTLVILRYTRVILSLAAICCGFEEIEASTMVTYLHDSRRYFHKMRRNAQKKTKQTDNRSTSFYPEIIGKTLVNRLSSVCTAWPTNTDGKIHSEKTLLETIDDDVHENGSNDSENIDSEETDSEDYDYRQQLLNGSFPESDESDDDEYVEEYESSVLEETIDSSHDDNSFFEEGEIESLQEDIERYNGREIVLDINERKTNGDNRDETTTTTTTTTTPSDVQTTVSEPINPLGAHETTIKTRTNNHHKDNGNKKPIKHKFNKGKPMKKH